MINENELSNLICDARDYCRAMINACKMTSEEAIEKTILTMQCRLTTESDVQEVRDALTTSFTQKISYGKNEEAININNSKSDHDLKWWETIKTKVTNVDTSYWKRYLRYLIEIKGWPDITVKNNIDQLTDNLMSRLADPNSGAEQDVRGLVFGHVQSGKTAHYIGLINKAIDAGYKIIVVLAGIHNNLRSQTQSRIDAEVLGYNTSRVVKFDASGNVLDKTQGVGCLTKLHKLSSITTQDEDGDINKQKPIVAPMPVICVVKKNKAALEELIGFWQNNGQQQQLSEVDANGKRYFGTNYPMLLIDDEADQASLNTQDSYDKEGNVKDNYAPSTINKLIRQYLNLFRCKSYVGYTATPYANLFSYKKVQPAEEREYGCDLFPKDFIHTLVRSEDYIGAREFFGWRDKHTDEKPEKDERAMTLYREIQSSENTVNNLEDAEEEGKDVVDKYIDLGLKDALLSFLISTACRKCRRFKNEPNTMLIHIERLIKEQGIIHYVVLEIWRDICSKIINGDKSLIFKIKQMWTEDYLPTTADFRNRFPYHMSSVHKDIQWDELFKEIQRLTNIEPLSYDGKYGPIKIYQINGESDDVLAYENAKKEDYNVIVIGGDKLSRGLTLEGLSVSYFLRSAKSYDTLMQMGRWFGYRPGYADLCRLYVTKDVYYLYQNISIATDNLVQQFKEVEQKSDATPYDVSFRVEQYEDYLLTSKNKQKQGALHRGSYSAAFSQTRLIDVNIDACNNNYEAVESLLEKAGHWIDGDTYFRENNVTGRRSKHYFWRNVSPELIIEFFDKYKTAKGEVSSTDVSSLLFKNYITIISKEANELKNWTICLINRGEMGLKFRALPSLIGIGGRNANRLKYQGNNIFDMGVTTSGGDEYLDYSAKQLSMIEEYSECFDPITCGKKAVYLREKIRDKDQGFLLLYPINLQNVKDESLVKLVNKLEHPPIGVALAFPKTETNVTIPDYWINNEKKRK